MNDIILMCQGVYCLIWFFWFLMSCWVVKCNQGGYNDYPFYLIQKEVNKDFLISRKKELEKLRDYQDYEGFYFFN